MMRPHALALVISALAVSPLAAQESHQHGDAGKLGTVKFANSCSAEAQPEFARGMALLHSFEFGEAMDAFAGVLKADPSCGIALWGTGLAQWGNPFSAALRPAAQLESGRATVERAAAAGAKTARERDFISAAKPLYDRFESVDQAARGRAYRDAMAQLSAKYPGDPEAAAFYALSLTAAADPADKTYADQLKAGAILEKLWTAQPDHPGFPHYIIHSYDVPALAPRAVDAARRYAKIAPAAPHALHMPSHTFTRLGYWQDSIDTNILSAAAARRVNAIGEELHASDYQTYAYLQSGQDAAARRVVDSLAEIAARRGPVTASAAPPPVGTYARAAILARYALERGAWSDAAALETHTTPYPYADAITWFARALGAARMHDVATAKAAVVELQKCIDRTTQAQENYWMEQLAIQKLGASAWLDLAEGRTADALASMRAAADREDRTEKAAISPGPLAPARELLGDMLLELKQPKAALVEYQKTMAKEPNRFRAIAGAAAAAAQAGDRAASQTYYRQLLTICAKADTPGRPELQAARAAK
jgi:hypothetical protein